VIACHEQGFSKLPAKVQFLKLWHAGVEMVNNLEQKGRAPANHDEAVRGLNRG
jgi:hypothetical protein